MDFSGTLVRYQPLKDVDMVYLIDFVPRSVREQPIYQSFIHGYSACYKAVCAVLRGGNIPTVQTVSQELLSPAYDARYTAHYFQKGGRIEFVLNGVAYRSWEEVSEIRPCLLGLQCFTYINLQGPAGDNTFDDTFGDNIEGMPICENDDAYNIVRTNMGLGPEFNGPDYSRSSFGLDEDEDEEMYSEDSSD